MTRKTTAKTTTKSATKTASKTVAKSAARTTAKTTTKTAAKTVAKTTARTTVKKTPTRKPRGKNGMAADLPFSTGDFVVYPTHGVGKVTGVESREIAGEKLKLFVIEFDKEKMTLRVPVQKASDSGLRKLSTRKVMDNAMKTLRGRSRVKRTMWSRRAQEYEAKINSGDPVSIAEVVRDLHRNAGQPDQSYSERQIYQAALDRLVRELAAVEKINEDAATKKLEKELTSAAAA